MHTSHKDASAFMIISCWIVIRIRNVLDTSHKENQFTHFTFNNFFSKNIPHEIMCKNVVGLNKPQITIQHIDIDIDILFAFHKSK